VRIIIEVDGEDVTVRTERTEKPPRTYSSDPPPPEILRAAAALGATSAGPAPSEGDLASLADEFSRTATAALPTESVDAGAGPFPPPGYSVTDTEDQAGEEGDRPAS
jgi:hypothetical protein